MAAQNFKLFLGCLGNGVTVCNSAVMEDGDFKMVAHISNEGKITWYVSEDYPPADALASIRACAEQERVKYETWLNGLSPAARREYQLERLPLPEFLEELRKAREEREGAYVEPRLYPRGFCVLGLEQLHGLLVCCEILLVLFFQRGEPFARSCEVCRFPLELVIICIRPKSPVSLTASGW